MPLSNHERDHHERRESRKNTQLIHPPWSPALSQHGIENHPEQGSAAVEFVFLATVLLLPVIYLILTLGQMQGGAYAVVSIADQAAKIIATSKDPASAQPQAKQAMILAVQDFGFSAQQVNMVVTCSNIDCSVAGTSISVTISLQVPLPLLPVLPGVNTDAATMQAQATQIVSSYR